MPIPLRNKQNQYLKFNYQPTYLLVKDEVIRKLSDSSANRLTSHFTKQNLIHVPLILDGGNFISNGMGTAITTNRIISDNEQLSVNEIKAWFKNTMGVEKLIILPVEPGDITGHIDGMVRFIDRWMVVVGDYPSSYKIGKEFMDRVSETLIRQGFKVVRVLNDIPELTSKKFPSAVGNYINYLRIGNTIYLPIYKNKEAFNNKAIELFQSLALEVIPVYADEIAEYGGVLNCITWHYY
jgi:agmatine deiminase